MLTATDDACGKGSISRSSQRLEILQRRTGSCIAQKGRLLRLSNGGVALPAFVLQN
jgi:hypothetical protein